MRLLIALMTATVAMLWHGNAMAQQRCAGRGGGEMARTAGARMPPELSGAALRNMAATSELARRNTVPPAYEAARQQYMNQRYLAYRRQLEAAEEEAAERTQVRQRKIEAIKQRREIAQARREAAKARRLAELASSGSTGTSSRN